MALISGHKIFWSSFLEMIKKNNQKGGSHMYIKTWLLAEFMSIDLYAWNINIPEKWAWEAVSVTFNGTWEKKFFLEQIFYFLYFL